MTAEEYRASGWYYSDYLKMSQWQRFRDMRFSMRRFGVSWLEAHVEMWGMGRIKDTWGIWCCQNFHYFSLGPLQIMWPISPARR